MNYAMNKVCAVADRLPPEVQENLRYLDIRNEANHVNANTSDRGTENNLRVIARRNRNRARVEEKING